MDKLVKEVVKLREQIESGKGNLAKLNEQVGALDSKIKQFLQSQAQYQDSTVNAKNYGYNDMTLPNGTTRSALEELIRWRLWSRTGGGLMAELGSHQLDAAGIFISALRKDHQKALPLTVSAVGGRHIFPLDRDCEDHVYCIYEFPGKGYFDDKDHTKVKDPNKKIGVTYSSINGNGLVDTARSCLAPRARLSLSASKK
jgi:hypothetical protein